MQKDFFFAYDAAVKRLLSHKTFLAHIMKECMVEYHDCTIEDIINRYIEGEPQIGQVGVDVDETTPRITGASTEDATLTEGTVFYDIRYTALAPKDEGLIRIIINIEAQNRSDPGYSLLKRALYYCSRMISAQKGTEFKGSNYDGIKKVYSVWICPNVPEAEKDSITVYSIKEAPMVGQVRKNPDEYDLLSVVMICLGDASDAPEKGILGLLEVLLKGSWTKAQRNGMLENQFGIRMNAHLKEEVGQMCNLSQGVYEAGMTKGVVQMLKTAMDKNGWTLEETMRFFDLPLSQKDTYMQAIKRTPQ